MVHITRTFSCPHSGHLRRLASNLQWETCRRASTRASSCPIPQWCHTTPSGDVRGRLASTVQWQWTVHRQPSRKASPSVSTAMRTKRELLSSSVKQMLKPGRLYRPGAFVLLSSERGATSYVIQDATSRTRWSTSSALGLLALDREGRWNSWVEHHWRIIEDQAAPELASTTMGVEQFIAKILMSRSMSAYVGANAPYASSQGKSRLSPYQMCNRYASDEEASGQSSRLLCDRD